MLCSMWASSTDWRLTADDKAELERIVRSGRTEQRHALRARIILGAAEGRSNNALTKRAENVATDDCGLADAVCGRWREGAF
jgi:hypothetical protein